jgi:hypothetical protein
MAIPPGANPALLPPLLKTTLAKVELIPVRLVWGPRLGKAVGAVGKMESDRAAVEGDSPNQFPFLVSHVAMLCFDVIFRTAAINSRVN